jgi:cytochrome c oxidase cbb3-type subunit IV
MTYDTVATISQVTSLLMFIAMFVAVVAYAVWPRNRIKFEQAQRRALDIDGNSPKSGGRQ